jgi:hypothetical protein
VGHFPTLVDVDGLGGTYARRLERAPSATAADARTAAAPAAAPAAAARPARPRAAAAASTATPNAAATAGPRSAAGPASWATASGPGATAATRCVTYAYGREDEECHDQEHEQPIENTHDQAPSAGENPRCSVNCGDRVRDHAQNRSSYFFFVVGTVPVFPPPGVTPLGGVA